jgi:hypothetical protein
MTTAERMLKRLRELLEPEGITLPEGTVLRRSNAGHWQRSEGAWSWFAFHPGGAPLIPGGEGDVGSCYPMGVLLKCDEVNVSRNVFALHVDPCGECITRYGRIRF